jgi:hypothetical protein
MALGEILGIISGVLLTLTSCALAAYYSGNAPCVTGYAAAKKPGLGIGGPDQILITGAGLDDQKKLLDVNATNGAIITQTKTVENVNVYNETNVNISNIKKTNINVEEQELIQGSKASQIQETSSLLQNNFDIDVQEADQVQTTANENSGANLNQNLLLVGGGDASSQGGFGSGRTPLVTPAPSPDFSYSGRGGLGDGFSTITKVERRRLVDVFLPAMFFSLLPDRSQ